MNRHLATLRHILQHPLNAGRALPALKRYVSWQVGSRLVPGPVLVPFVNGTVLVMSPGMTGATQHYYTGLHEFADCGFLLHLLRADELFVDIGANVGVFTVLAAGAVGAKAIAIEPVSDTFSRLERNVHANGLAKRVKAHNLGLGSAASTLRFTTDLDTTNRVVHEKTYSGSTVEVPVRTLDSLLSGREPSLIKLDVEGWEAEVLIGAKQTLERTTLLALIVETDGSRETMNASEQAVHTILQTNGFTPCTYDPMTRGLSRISTKNVGGANTLYCRSLAALQERLYNARPFQVNGRSI